MVTEAKDLAEIVVLADILVGGLGALRGQIESSEILGPTLYYGQALSKSSVETQARRVTYR